MKPTDLKDPNYELKINDDDWNNNWVRTKECDWVYQYLPSDDGTDGVRTTGQYELTNNKEYIVKGNRLNIFLIDAPFFLKCANVNLWIDGNNTAHDLVNKFNWGLYTISNNDISLKYVIPHTLPNGSTLESVLKAHDNHFQIITDVAKNTLEIRINNVGCGSVSLSSLGLNSSQKHYFGFDIRSKASDVKITKAINYTTNLDTTITLTRSNDDARFDVKDKVQFSVVLKDEYNKPVQETIRLFCNSEHVSFVTTGGSVTKEEGTRYYNTTTNFYQGKVLFNVYNTTNTATSFSVQVHLSRNYFYNYSISEGIKSYYRTQPTIDTSNINDIYWYLSNKKITFKAFLKDNHGNEITSEYAGNFSVNDKLVANGTWNGSGIQYSVTKIPSAPEYKDYYVLKWTFAGNNLYYPVETVKNILVKKAKLTVTYTGLKESYTYPQNISFNINVTCDNPEYTIPQYKVYRDNTEIPLRGQNGNLVLDQPSTTGVANYKIVFEGSDTIGAFTEEVQTMYYAQDYMHMDVEYYPDRFRTGDRVTFDVDLYNDDGPLVGKYIYGHVLGVKTDGTTFDATEFLEEPYLITDEWGHVDDFAFQTDIGGKYYFSFSYLSCVGTVELEYEKQLLNFWYKGLTTQLEYKYYEPATIQFQAQENYSMMPLPNITAYYRITFKKFDGSEAYGEPLMEWTPIVSDEEGWFPPITYTQHYGDGEVIGTFEIKIENDDFYEDWLEKVQVRWNKVDTTLTLSSSTRETDVLSKGIIVVTLKDDEGTPLRNLPIKTSITWTDLRGDPINYVEGIDGTGTKITHDTGKATAGFTPLNCGNVIGTIHFEFEGNAVYNPSSYTGSITWNKIEARLVKSSSTEETEVTLKGFVAVTLVDSEGEPIQGLPVTSNIYWMDFNGNDVEVTGLDHTGLRTTNQYGRVTGGFTPLNRGDIIGMVKFTFDSDIYTDSIYSSSITWHKINTELTADDVTIYNGRYTNIAKTEPDWTTASPGTDSSYKNFHAKLVTKDTETGYVTVPDAKIKYLNYQNNVLFETEPVDENGDAYQRWTRNYQNVPASYEINAVYDGDDIFKPATTSLMFKILKRIETSLTKYTREIYPPNFRYNVPFDFGATLKAGTDPLKNQKVKIYFDNTDKGFKTTNTNGLAQFTNYVVKDVKTCAVKAEFDKDDLIDKYLPSTVSYNIIVQKDYTILTMTTGTSVYTSCGNALVKFTLTDSLERGIVDKIYVSYDNGTYKSPKWIPIDENYLTTDTNGKINYTMKAYSGIRIVQGEFKETWCYLPITSTVEVIYDVNREYLVNLTNGKAEVDVDCFLGESKGIPEGLYDVQIEYLPPETETGKCQLYANSETFQPLRKKKTALLKLISEETTTEAGIPLFLTTKLTNIKNEAMPDEKINSRIDGIYPSIPDHITTTNGEIERGYTDKKINFTDNYNFKFSQTREYAGTTLDVETHTTKIKPTITVQSPITTYSGVDTTLEATVYYERKKYDTYGQEVKLTSQGVEVYHNPLAKNNPDYPEYYYIENKVKVATTKAIYDSAQSQTTRTYLKNKDVIWRGSGGTTELVRAKTNSEGKATATYHRNSLGTVTIYATTDEDVNYFAASTPIQMETKAKLETYFVQPLEQGKTMQETVYHHETEYGAYLMYKDSDGTSHPLPNQQVIFRKGWVAKGTAEELGTRTTDEDGYVSINRKEESYKVSYEVIFRGDKEYLKTSDIFVFKVNPQTPIITVSLSKDEINFNESVTATVSFTEDELSATTGIATNKIFVTEIAPDGTVKNIGYMKTLVDEHGQSSGEIKITPSSVGNVKIKVACDHESLKHLYNPVSAEATVRVKKIPTKIVENTRSEDDGNDMIVTLMESNTNKVIPYQKIKFYDGTTLLTEVETNSKGVATGNGAFLSIGSHNIKAVFEGTDLYYSSNLTYSLNARFLIDTCNDLSSWDVILENWYASDGSSKYGMDIDGLNQYPDQQRRCAKYDVAHVNSVNKCNCSPVNETNYKAYRLRTYCDDLKTEGYQDNNGIHAPTGVVLVNKYITTSNNCIITYKMMVKYNGINYNSPGKAPINDEFGGHMGLMKRTKKVNNVDTLVSTAEGSKVRFEIYRKNSYCMIDGQIEQKWNGSRWVEVNNVFAYKFEANTWYTVTIDITEKTVEYSIAPLEGTCAYNFKADKVVEGLSPYIFAFTNGTEFILREMKIEYRQ